MKLDGLCQWFRCNLLMQLLTVGLKLKSKSKLGTGPPLQALTVENAEWEGGLTCTLPWGHRRQTCKKQHKLSFWRPLLSAPYKQTLHLATFTADSIRYFTSRISRSFSSRRGRRFLNWSPAPLEAVHAQIPQVSLDTVE